MGKISINNLVTMKTIVKKQGEVRTRDWLIATGQAIVVAVAQVLLDVIPTTGLKFDWEVIAITAIIVFLNHVVRKASETDRKITVEDK